MSPYLFVSHSSFLHGAERALLETLDALVKYEECEIHVVIPKGFNEGLKYELLLRSLRVYEIDANFTNWVGPSFSKWRFLWKNLLLFFSVLWLLIKIRPSSIIINSIVNTPVFALSAKLFGVKVVWNIHEFGDVDHNLNFLLNKHFTHKVISLLSDSIIFNSEVTKNAFLNFGRTPFRVVKNAINQIDIGNKGILEGFNKTGVWTIILVGRTAEGKGQIDLIKAISIIVNEYNFRKIKVYIVGAVKSPYTIKLTNEITALGLNQYVHLVPFQGDVNKYFRDADIGVVASKMEAFGRITVEYLKSGLVVVGANSAGTAEILSDFQGETFLYRSGDTNDLANQLMNVFNTSPIELHLRLQSQMAKAQRLYNLDVHYSQFKDALSFAFGRKKV